MEARSNRPAQQQHAFRLKGTMPALTMLCLETDDLEAIERQLVEHISQMPQFFMHAPVLLDLAALGESLIDLGGLAEMLRSHSLVPVAVRSPTELQRECAINAGWGVLQASIGRPQRQAKKDDASSSTSPTPTPPAPATAPERITAGLTVRRPIRSGQMVRAVGGDLVVLAPVSSGAELIADGNIHVYAPFRGRALAGASGNTDAAIFCTNLDAEFVSIAGRALTYDDIPKALRGEPCRVSLDGDAVVVSPLDHDEHVVVSPSPRGASSASVVSFG